MNNYNSADVAIKLAEKYRWKVFPVCRDSKKPCYRGWQQNATNNPDEIIQLFKNVPKAMIGLPTGDINMLTVFDIDVKNGVNGIETMLEMGIKMSSRAIVQTPSGGFHFYHFSGLKKFKSSAGKIGAGIDVRCFGGYVVAPGSQGTKGTYKWLNNEPEPNQIGAISEQLFDLLEATDQQVYSSFSGKRPTISSILDPVYEGNRNNTMTSRCGALFSRGYSAEDVYNMMEYINRAAFHPPIDDKELHNIFKSIRRREGV